MGYLVLKNFLKRFSLYKDIVTKGEHYDSLVSVRLMKEYLWDGDKPLNYTMEKHTISQELPNWYVVTNGIYMAPRKLMLERKYFLGFTPYLFEVNKIAAIDIDDVYDYEMVKAIYDYQKKIDKHL